MTDPQQPPSDGAGPVGSAAEEAAKLFGALKDAFGQAIPGGAPGAAGFAAGVADGVRAGAEEHLATGAPECNYCPLCRGIHVLREASPEVREHLATAASALLQAASSILAAAATSSPADGQSSADADAPSGVEPIDLDGDLGEDLGEDPSGDPDEGRVERPEEEA